MKYRWKDRGKEAPTLGSIEQSPPPPYQEEWVDARVSLIVCELRLVVS